MTTIVRCILVCALVGGCTANAGGGAGPPELVDAGGAVDAAVDRTSAPALDARAAPDDVAAVPAPDGAISTCGCSGDTSCFGHANDAGFCFLTDPCGQVAPFNAAPLCGIVYSNSDGTPTTNSPPNTVTIDCGGCPSGQQCGGCIQYRWPPDTAYKTWWFPNTCIPTCATLEAGPGDFPETALGPLNCGATTCLCSTGLYCPF